VIVNVGAGEGVRVGIRVEVSGIGVEVGRGGFDGAQAVIVARSVSSVEINFVA
jgi:hypothetical protein